jgi:hypothetical protein
MRDRSLASLGGHDEDPVALGPHFGPRATVSFMKSVRARSLVSSSGPTADLLLPTVGRKGIQIDVTFEAVVTGVG